MMIGLHTALSDRAARAAAARPEALLTLDFAGRRFWRDGAPAAASDIFAPASTPLRFAPPGHPDGPGLLCEAGDRYLIELGDSFAPDAATVLVEAALPDLGVNQDLVDLFDPADPWGRKWLTRWNVNNWQTVLRRNNTADGLIQAGAHQRPVRLAASFGNGQLSLAVNGALVGTVPTQAPGILAALRVGNNHSGANPVQGTIISLALLSSALTESEFSTLS